MKKNLLFLLVFLVTIVIAVVVYFAFTPKVHTDIPLPLTGENAPPTTATGKETTFEQSFYQDLSDLFNGEPNGYEDIQGTYGFITGEES